MTCGTSQRIEGSYDIRLKEPQDEWAEHLAKFKPAKNSKISSKKKIKRLKVVHLVVSF